MKFLPQAPKNKFSFTVRKPIMEELKTAGVMLPGM